MAEHGFNGTDAPAPGARREPAHGHGGGPSSLPPSHGREPVFNIPAPVIAFALLLTAIHLLRTLLLPASLDNDVILAFAFIPARYGELASQLPMPAAAIWSPLTYSLLHGNWTHLAVNLLWLLAFATPVARRLGTVRTLAIAVLSSLAGAVAHYLAFPGELVPVIGASAVVSGCMGAAARFAFTGRRGALLNVDGPAQSLVASFSNPGFLAFLGVWLVINYVAGTGALQIAGQGVTIAWQAHVGGFLAGLLSFSLLDRPQR